MTPMIHIKKMIVLMVFCSMTAVLLLPHASATITLTDSAGKTLVLDKLPQRLVVVGAGPYIPLHMLYMFEETKERLKGFEVKYKMKDEFLELVDPKLSLKQTLDTNPGPESVASLKPDLVIIKATSEGNLARSLKALGIPVLHMAPETPDMFFRDIENLGKILGNEERAKIIAQYFQDKLSLIKDKVGALTLAEKSRTLVLEYNNRGNTLSLNVPAMGWFQTHQALLSGGNPVWLDSLTVSDGWQITGFEQVAAWNPDKIFLIVWYQMKGSAVVKSFYEDSKWSRLKALQKKELHLFPQDIFGWDSATPRWILGTLWMAKMTYPDKFTKEVLDMNQTVKEFFKTLYRFDEATIEQHLMPRKE
ncbi:MAG: ABC transporter substrate-binding protein [Desulfobacula sp.]